MAPYPRREGDKHRSQCGLRESKHSHYGGAHRWNVEQAQQEEKNLKAKAALGNKINLLQNEIGNSTDPDLIKKKISAFREEVYSS